MKWIAISGSWRITNEEIENNVRKLVRKIISRSDGIITGGALNVDYFAVDEALKIDSSGKSVKVFLPTSLEIFDKHFQKKAGEGVITRQQAENLIKQLSHLKKINPLSLIEGKEEVVNKEAYFQRISKIIEATDELYAFWVNNSEGVGDTIKKAKIKNIPVKIFKYIIKEEAHVITPSSQRIVIPGLTRDPHKIITT